MTDEAGLLAALAAAGPGKVIALQGMIAVTHDVTIASSITLTCATPGSGLAVAPGAPVGTLVFVTAPFVVVDRVTLDGSGALGEPYFALNDPNDIDGDGLTGFATNLRLTNSTVLCGPGECAFLVGVPGAVITDNRFVSNGSFTGVHLQPTFGPPPTFEVAGRPDGSRLERNTLIATAPSFISIFGAIRTVQTANVMIADNVILGPWFNSLSPTRDSGLTIRDNRLEGAVQFGMFVSSSPAGLLVRNSVVFRNRIAGAGVAGIFAHFACRNVFFHNNLNGNAFNNGAFFSVVTGANIMVIPPGDTSVVSDAGGTFDCDGDGVGDPNVITGPRVVRWDGPPGPPETPATARAGRGIELL